MKQHILLDPLPALSRGGYGEMVVKGMGREKKKKRNGGRGPFIPSTNDAFLKCDSSLSLESSLSMSMPHARLFCLPSLFTRGPSRDTVSLHPCKHHKQVGMRWQRPHTMFSVAPTPLSLIHPGRMAVLECCPICPCVYIAVRLYTVQAKPKIS